MEEVKLTNLRVQRLVAIVFFICLTIVFFISFNTIKAKAKDIKRRADISILVKALDLYHDKYGNYPTSVDDWRGWDLTYEFNGREQNFLQLLKEQSFINKMIVDPINNATYHYRYQKFATSEAGCKEAFYILQITNFELPTTNNGRGQCPDFNWGELTPNGYTVQGFD